MDTEAELKALLGADHVLRAEDLAPPMWQTNQPCLAQHIVRPASTEEVAAVLKLCNARGQSVVPYGGVTNLVQSCATSASDVVMSFERWNRIEETDRDAMTMVAQAGVTMRAAQEAADAAGLFFPVDIGARDACEVGGFISTNAGGTKVIRYGMTRDSVLGLEVVLADGTVVSSMNRYIKNNSGFDLKQLFIGSEGVLGVITRAVFRLSVKPSSHQVAMIACRDFATVSRVLSAAQRGLGATLTGFEVMWDNFFRRATQPLGRLESPFEGDYSVYAIIESMGTNEAADEQLFMQVLEALFEEDLIQDAVIAKSAAEQDAIWAIRNEVEWLVTSAQNFDVSLRTADVEKYVSDISKAIRAEMPDAEIATFGHLGDNNLHVSVISNDDAADATERVERHIYECLQPFAGAISAEHGIGLEKKHWLSISRSDAEIDLMRTLKKSMDPNNILNPGKVV